MCWAELSLREQIKIWSEWANEQVLTPPLLPPTHQWFYKTLHQSSWVFIPTSVISKCWSWGLAPASPSLPPVPRRSWRRRWWWWWYGEIGVHGVLQRANHRTGPYKLRIGTYACPTRMPTSQWKSMQYTTLRHWSALFPLGMGNLLRCAQDKKHTHSSRTT